MVDLNLLRLIPILAKEKNVTNRFQKIRKNGSRRTTRSRSRVSGLRTASRRTAPRGAPGEGEIVSFNIMYASVISANLRAPSGPATSG